MGVIVPTVDDVDRAREAAKWSRYPPIARRSSGLGQAARLWGINGINYRAPLLPSRNRGVHFLFSAARRSSGLALSPKVELT